LAALAPKRESFPTRSRIEGFVDQSHFWSGKRHLERLRAATPLPIFDSLSQTNAVVWLPLVPKDDDPLTTQARY
jgi:hypothetical protein